VKITVVGGGIIGCARPTSWPRRLRVTLFERARPARRPPAPRRAPAPLGAPTGSALERLALASWRLYPELVDELRERTGIEVEYVTAAHLSAPRCEDVRQAEARVAGHLSSEFGIGGWDTAEVRAATRAGPRLRGAMFVGADHWVNNSGWSSPTRRRRWRPASCSARHR